MFPISIYICYNWLFLTAYKDKLYCDDNTNTKIPEEGETVIKCRPTDDNIRYEISFDDLGSTISGLFNFILDFSIQPTYWVDKVMLGNDYFPKYLNMIPFKILIKLVILIFAIGVVYAFDIYSAFNDIMFGGVITGNYSSVNIFCTTIIMWYYGYYIYEDITSQFSTKISPLDDVSTMTSLPGVVEKGKEITEDLIEKYKNLIKWSSMPFILIFILILKYIIRFILAVWNIGISEIVLKLFIWIHSMFGIALYGGGIGNISKNMDDIDAFVNIDLEKLSEDNPDYIEYSLFRKILIAISTFLYNNLYYFVYLIMIVSTVVASIVNIKSPSLKTVLSTLISLQGVIIVFLMFLKKKVTSVKTQLHANKYTVPQ